MHEREGLAVDPPPLNRLAACHLHLVGDVDLLTRN